MADDLPRDELLTLQEAADRLKVHYMTAYRWVRRGELAAFKAGGRLRVRASDLDSFMTDRTVDSALPREGQRTDWPLHVERFYEHLLLGETVEAGGLVRKVVADGAPAGDVYMHLLTPALHRIGEAWADGDVCVAVEHRATEITIGIMARLGDIFRRRGPGRGAAVTLTPPAEHHSLATQMVADFLRAGGYEVEHLGADVPLEDLGTFLRSAPPLVVCVSVTNSDTEAGLYGGIVSTAREANPDVVVAFGGQGVDAATAQSAGGVAVTDLSELNDRLGELIPA